MDEFFLKRIIDSDHVYLGQVFPVHDILAEQDTVEKRRGRREDDNQIIACRPFNDRALLEDVTDIGNNFVEAKQILLERVGYALSLVQPHEYHAVMFMDILYKFH